MRAVRALQILERRFPRIGPLLRKAFVEFGVPLNRAIGIRVDARTSGPDRTVLRLPPRRRNMNVGGTIHGGVITAFAETVHGVAVLWHFHPADHQMVTRSLQVDFLAPGRGALVVDFSLPDSDRRQISMDLANLGKCDISLMAEVHDTHGNTIARLTGIYTLRQGKSVGNLSQDSAGMPRHGKPTTEENP